MHVIYVFVYLIRPIYRTKLRSCSNEQFHQWLHANQWNNILIITAHLGEWPSGFLYCILWKWEEVRNTCSSCGMEDHGKKHKRGLSSAWRGGTTLWELVNDVRYSQLYARVPYEQKVMQRAAQVSYGKFTDSENSRWRTTASEKGCIIPSPPLPSPYNQLALWAHLHNTHTHTHTHTHNTHTHTHTPHTQTYIVLHTHKCTWLTGKYFAFPPFLVANFYWHVKCIKGINNLEGTGSLGCTLRETMVDFVNITVGER